MIKELNCRRIISLVIGRDEEIERAIQVLSRRTKNNPCLIGEPGVGHSCFVDCFRENGAP
jgi:ATP-dependent Clp protease ATP-binding subunit ClpC